MRRKKNEQAREDNQKAALEQLLNRDKKVSMEEMVPEAKSKEELELKILRQMLKCLSGLKYGKFADNMHKLNAIKGYYEQSMAMSAFK